MKPRPQRPRQLIPAAGMIETAVNQDQRRRRRVTPIREMKPKSLGLVGARLRAVLCCVHGGYVTACGCGGPPRGGRPPHSLAGAPPPPNGGVAPPQTR